MYGAPETMVGMTLFPILKSDQYNKENIRPKDIEIKKYIYDWQRSYITSTRYEMLFYLTAKKYDRDKLSILLLLLQIIKRYKNPTCKLIIWPLYKALWCSIYESKE